MIKVVEAMSDMNIGGAGVLLANRLKHTDLKKINTVVILPKGSALKPKLKKMSVKIIEINGGKDKSFDIKGFFSYLMLLYRLRPDIINSHGSLNSRIAATITQVPTRIYTRHR